MKGARRRWQQGVVALAATWALAGCSAEVYHGLDEASANEMIVALEQHGIDGTKESDPVEEGRWVVVVPSASEVDAWRVLQAEGLPRPEPQGFEAFYPSGGLIPTSSEERVLLQYATAQELRRSLLAVDGIVDARVNLVLPGKSRVPMPNQPDPKPRASVLVKYRPAPAGAEGAPQGGAPVDVAQVRRLVAGGVEELDLEAVEVILTAERRSQKPLAEPRFEQVGPISVAPQSKRWMQLVVGLLSLAVVGMGALIAFLLLRGRRRVGAA